MLAVSFSAADYVGHRWGPTSHELQDTLLRLDVQIGRLLDALDARVGAGNYVVAFSSDHGASPIPEQMTAAGLDAGRFTNAALNARVIDAWKAATSDSASPIAGGVNMYFTPRGRGHDPLEPQKCATPSPPRRSRPQVLRLRFGLGLRQDQIARSCSIGQATVHRYLERAAAMDWVGRCQRIAITGGSMSFCFRRARGARLLHRDGRRLSPRSIASLRHTSI